MRSLLRNRLTRPRRKLTASDVIQGELEKAHDIHPAHLMSGAVICALADAGFEIMRSDDLESEIALAYQAGVDSATEA